MSSDANKTLIRRGFEEGMNQQNPAVFDEVIGANYVNHDMPMATPGVEGFKQVIGMFQSAFPDMKITIEDEFGEGDRVATRGHFTGTHQGEFMGIPATGKPVTVKYIDIWRVENGQAVENWVQMDMMGMMKQLGVIPSGDESGS